MICAVLIIFACKDKNPTNEDFFVGTYKGSVSYTNNDGDKEAHDDAKVTVVKTGSKTKYNFKFSNGISNLTGVEFKKEGDKRMVNVDLEDGVQYIKIDKNDLKMLYSKDGQVWEANAKRE